MSSHHGRGAALVAAICALTCANASAATFVVDKTADDAGAGACDTGTANDCSLRSAIKKANVDTTADAIALGAATYTEDSSQEPITQPVTITGAGARVTAIDGGGVSQRLLTVNTTGAVTVSDLAAQHSAAGSIVAAVTVDTAAPMTLTRVALVDNAGMGLFQNGGSVELISSLVARNTAPAIGGLTNTADLSFMLIASSTIAQNTALPAGSQTPVALAGGFSNRGETAIIDSTIAGNRIAAGAIPLGGDNVINQAHDDNTAGVLRLTNTIVADAGANGNCAGVVQTGGHNLDSDGTCGFHATNDHPGVDPLLAALADNGGPTDTRALSANSPAVDAGGGCGPADQRGVARPAGGACDIGAFESPFTAAAATPPGTTTPTTTSPATQADTTPPALTVGGIGKTVKRKAFNKGLKVKIGANEPIAAELTLLATPRKVTIAKVPSVALATVSLTRAGGTRTVTLKPSTKIKGTRSVKMRLIVVAFDAAGNRSSKTVAFTVK